MPNFRSQSSSRSRRPVSSPSRGPDGSRDSPGSSRSRRSAGSRGSPGSSLQAAAVPAATAIAAAWVAYALPALTGAGYAVPALEGPAAALRRALAVQTLTCDRRGCALTFDDGPHPAGTPALLEILAAAGVRATFFLVGEQVRANPSLAAEIVACGHVVGLHCDRHRNLLRLSPSQVRTDLEKAEASIIGATGCSPQLYRPPYGILNAAALLHARREGWRTLLWSQWGRDWEARATPSSIAEHLTEGLKEGSVLLLHDADHYCARGSWRRTAAALPTVIATVRERGLSFSTP